MQYKVDLLNFFNLNICFSQCSAQGRIKVDYHFNFENVSHDLFIHSFTYFFDKSLTNNCIILFDSSIYIICMRRYILNTLSSGFFMSVFFTVAF